MNFSLKYYPPTLDDVIGHKNIIIDLKRRSKERNFPTVSLFTGQPGSGKTMLQKILAKNILCNNTDENGNSCNKCEICNTVNEEGISNYYYLYNGSNVNIETARQIEDLALARSLSVTRKVIMIDEIQETANKNRAALNNLLKLFERNIKNTHFILGSMRNDVLKNAEKRRTIRYNLSTLTTEEIGTQLINICKQESIDLNTEEKMNVIITIAQNSDNCIGVAIPLLERVIYSDLWKSEDLINDLGIVSQTEIINWINGFLNNDASVLNMQITVETLEKINYTLLIFYKKLLGVYVPQWQQKTYLNGLQTNSIEKVKNGLLFLNDYLYYNYTNQYLIDFVVLNAFNEVNKNNELKPKRRKME